jgi:PII-like signaling protein
LAEEARLHAGDILRLMAALQIVVECDDEPALARTTIERLAW